MSDVPTVADLPEISRSETVIRLVTHTVTLEQLDIERAILVAYRLPADTKFVWDISTRGQLRSLTVLHSSSEETKS